MTHIEDVKRASTPDTIDYLNARIDALQKRVEFLENFINIKEQEKWKRANY